MLCWKLCEILRPQFKLKTHHRTMDSFVQRQTQPVMFLLLKAIDWT